MLLAGEPPRFDKAQGHRALVTFGQSRVCVGPQNLDAGRDLQAASAPRAAQCCSRSLHGSRRRSHSLAREAGASVRIASAEGHGVLAPRPSAARQGFHPPLRGARAFPVLETARFGVLTGERLSRGARTANRSPPAGREPSSVESVVCTKVLANWVKTNCYM